METTNDCDGAPLTHTLENVSRRPRKVKNLEKEVEMILSQDENEDETEIDENGAVEPLLKTPSTRRRQKVTACTPQASESVLQDMLQTPRRSCRKSIKPPQDYDDIVKQSARRSARKKLNSLEENNEENENNDHDEEHPKWTAASVGRSSTKRTRKSRRNTNNTGRGKRNLNETALDEPSGGGGDAHVSSNAFEENNDATVQVKEEKETEDLTAPEVMVHTVHEEIEKKENALCSAVKEEEQEDVCVSNEEAPQEHVVDDEINLIQNEDEHEKCQLKEEETTEEVICLIEEDPEEQAEDKLTQMQEEDKHADDEDIQLIQEEEEEEENIVKELKEEPEDKLNDIPPLKMEEEDDIHVPDEEEDVKDISMISIKDDSIIEEIKEEKQIEKKEEEMPHLKTQIEEEVDEKPSLENDSFGSYLKSKEIDMDDLGLNPINDDDETDAVSSIKQEVKKAEYEILASAEQPEEMPSLILCDDDDEGEEVVEDNEKSQKESANLNETYDAEDKVVINEGGIETTNAAKEDTLANDTIDNFAISTESTEMDKLQLSDDEEEDELGPAKKKPKVMFSNQIPSSPSTPKQSRMPVRHLTPYRTKSDSKPKSEPQQLHGSGKKLPLKKENLNFSTSELTTMTPRDIVLRGIRKRSLSVCLGSASAAPKLTRSAKKAQQKAVNFYSPANQTAIIEDLDKQIIENFKRRVQKSEEENKAKNVTTRRKRSYSFDDSTMSKSICVTSRLPRPLANQKQFLNSTTISTSSSSSSSSMIKPTRTKLPNFAAIHQKQFQKMENLADHVARKQERSKILINSNSKIRPASAQKSISTSMKNNNTNPNEKPKALKRIDMTSSQSQTQNKQAANTSINVARKIPLANNQNKNPSTEKITTSSNLPDPRDAKHITMKPKYATTTTNTNSSGNVMPKKHLQPTQSFNVSTNANSFSFKPKPTFNLSTQVAGGSTASSRLAANTSIVQKKPTTTAGGLSNQDKMASRLQRHIDMFKGRVPAARAGVASRKNEAAIKGVRSNRRFELQMQHRKNIEN
ncbi:putative leucine-rich repeat-containing protein DDB_G0290503 [Musca vetustissima]|uniref:putative leucine-rich repeat-containing protein DDB_G0290503 n=1 Tax=Musca vetustissima TaxID=27455 RepID=UPI002AB6FD44|nr:putative leucine-rich repeat-containing protein DDB_G0290503 [Musca vetustissima]